MCAYAPASYCLCMACFYQFRTALDEHCWQFRPKYANITAPLTAASISAGMSPSDWRKSHQYDSNHCIDWALQITYKIILAIKQSKKLCTMSIVLNKSLCGRGHPALRLLYVLYETCDRYVNRVCSIGNIWWWKRSMGASIWICTGAAIDTESLFRVHHTRHTHSPRDRTYVCITAAHRWRNIYKYNGLGKVNQTNWLRWTWMTVPMLGIQGTVVREQNDGSWARWRCAHIGWAVTNLHQLSCTNQLAAGAGKGLEDDFDVDWKKKQISWYRTHSKNFCCLVVRRTSRCMCR